MTDLLQEATETLRNNHMRPKHALGQNFLINEQVYDTIIQAANLKLSDTVVEIGPGLGFLTRKLAQYVHELHAYEIDSGFVRLLRTYFKDTPHVVIHEKSGLEYRPPATTYKIIANIPYYLTSAFIKRHLEEVTHRPDKMVLMLQKEVAEEIVVKSGNYSLLAVSVHTFADPSIVAYVPKTDFYPVPAVDSAIICIDVRDQQFDRKYLKNYFRVVKAGFASRRKQLKNNFKQLVPDEGSLLKCFKQAEIDPVRRAETLSIREWHTLTRLFQEYLNH